MNRKLPTLRRATVEDAGALAQLAETTFRDAFAAQNNVSDLEMHCSKTFASEIQLEEICDTNIITILAEDESALAGYAQVHLRSAKECVPFERPCELRRIYVLEAFHGLGFAHEIMREVLTIARQSQAGVIWLGVWEENPRAITFYKKYGFEIVGEHAFLLGTEMQTDLIMARGLEN